MGSIKVLLVEDHEMTRLGISLVCENTEDIELIGEAADGKSGIEAAVKLHPDVVLMDIGLPETDGIQASAEIKKLAPDVKILMFTSREGEKDVFDSLAAGADGYIMKGADKKQLTAAIRAAASGAAWLDAAIARLVLASVKNQNYSNQKETAAAKNSKNKYDLTERELQVLSLIVEGLNNEDIASRLCVELSTAKAHVHNILQKLYVKNRTQASRLAVKEGLI